MNGSPTRHVAASLAALLALAPLACARYRPTLPLRSHTGDVELELLQLRAGADMIETTFSARAVAAHEIRSVKLTVPTRAPCSRGASAVTIETDGRRFAGLPAGEHRLRLRFEEPIRDLTLDLVADIELADGQCLRTPAVSQSVPLERATQMVALVSVPVDLTDLAGLRGLAGIRLGGGRWLGPLLVSVEGGLSGATCQTSTCGEKDGGGLRETLSYSASAGALWAGGLRLHPWTALLGVRYTFAPVRLQALDGDRRFDTHSVHAQIGFGIGMGGEALRDGPVRHIERMYPMELTIPVGVTFAPDSPGSHAAISGGVAIRFLFAL